MAFRSTPGGGLAVAADDPTHPIVTPNDTWAIALNSDARWREIKALVDALAGMSRVGPGDVTDAAMAALLANPGTRTSKGVDARIHQALEENADGVRPEWFREPEDVDDTASIQAALDAAQGRPVVLTAGKTYEVSKQLYVSGTDVTLVTDGGAPATIRTSVDSTVLRIMGNAPSVSATLTGGVSIGSRFWPVPSGTAFRPGMLLTVKSDKLWYHDPRNLAKKSELGMVWGIGATEVRTVDPANDGYPTTETVTVTGADPIRVRIEGVRISGTGTDGQVRRGIHIQGAALPLLRDVEVVDCPTTGVFFDGCYGPRVENARVSGSNAVTTGYGVQTSGCRHTRVVHSTFWGGRRAVDFSGGEIISIDSKAIDCQALGGGVEFNGIEYGWLANNSTGAINYGFGSHGPSDGAEYVRCTTQGIQYPYSLRGANERVVDFRHLGPTRDGVISLIAGRNVTVRGGEVLSLSSGADKSTDMPQGGANINERRADCLISVGKGYDSGSSVVSITDTYAELEHTGVRFDADTVFGGHVHMSGCTFRFATPSGATAAAVFRHGSSLVAAGGRWRIGPVDFSRIGGTAPVTLTSGVDLNGKQVLLYPNSGPTT